MSTKMTREELLADLALLTDVGTKAAASRVLDHLLDTIALRIKSGGEVHLGNHFGTFKATTQASKTGIVLGKSYTTPAKTVIKFKPSSKLKDFIAKS